MPPGNRDVTLLWFIDLCCKPARLLTKAGTGPSATGRILLNVNAHVELALWILNFALKLLLVLALFWRKLHRRFPIFFAYVLFELVDFVMLFPIHQYGSYDLYFYTYWSSAVIELAIGFKVIHEVFLDVFRPYHTLKDLGTVLFKWASLVMILVALVVAVSTPGGQSPIVMAVTSLQRCMRVIQCGLVLFLLLFAGYLAVSWKQHAFGIVLGFGVFASAQLTWNALFAGGLINEQTCAMINGLSYCGAVLIWLGYAASKRVPREASPLVSQRWEQSLTDLQHPVPAHSLIPMFEGMVDRAFSNTPGGNESQTFSTKLMQDSSTALNLNDSISLARLHSLR